MPSSPRCKRALNCCYEQLRCFYLGLGLFCQFGSHLDRRFYRGVLRRTIGVPDSSRNWRSVRSLSGHRIGLWLCPDDSRNTARSQRLGLRSKISYRLRALGIARHPGAIQNESLNAHGSPPVYLEKYDSGMKPFVKATTRIAAWLLCLVMTWLSVSSPHCDLCDGPHATIFSSLRPVINHPAPVEPGACNGVCSCCGFHWLPDPDPVLSFIHTVSTASPAEMPSPLRLPRPFLFRPPRTAVSS